MIYQFATGQVHFIELQAAFAKHPVLPVDVNIENQDPQGSLVQQNGRDLNFGGKKTNVEIFPAYN